MPDEPQYAYGRHRTSGAYLHISEVPSGLACDCVCPGCRGPFVAHRGPSDRLHHFQHHALSPDCTHSPESDLHIGAKLAVLRAGWITTPPLYPRDPAGNIAPPAAKPTQHPKLTAIQDEFRGLTGIVPDLYAVDPNGKPLIIEVHVAHAVDPAKLAKIRELDIRAIEIHLERNADPATVLTVAPRNWLHHPRQAELDAAVAARLASAQAAQERLRIHQQQAQDAQREAARLARQVEQAARAAELLRQARLTDEQRRRELIARQVAKRLTHLCVVCGSDRAHFGFGPPLVPKLVWTCRDHRANVDPALKARP